MTTAQPGAAVPHKQRLRALAITGPRSKSTHLHQFLAVAQELSLTLDVLESPTFAEAENKIAQARPQLILLFGGDGTLNRWLSLLVAAKVTVLPVPSGSGNDFAHSAGIRDWKHALEIWRLAPTDQTEAIAFDLGQMEFADGTKRYFSCCANVGVDADAARRANALPDWLKQRKGYFLGGLAAILCYQPQRLRVESDGHPLLNENAWLVSVSNTPVYGGGLKIAPQASLTDGLLDITYLRAISRLSLMKHFPKILTGKHIGASGLETFTTTFLRIETGAPQPVFADGEPMGQTPVTIRVVPKAMSVLLAR